MAEEQELTPEEKLLKVIQKGEPKADSTGKVAEAAPAGSTSTDAPVLISSVPTSGRGLKILNRIMAVTALVFVLLAGYETYLNVPAEVIPYPTGDIHLKAEQASSTAPARMSDTLDIFAQRRIFGQPPPNVATNITPDTDNLIGWRAYARENLSLIGMSDVKRMSEGTEQVQREAIVMDNKLKKMHFLTEGKSLILSGQNVSIVRIGESDVELKLGEEILTIER